MALEHMTHNDVDAIEEVFNNLDLFNTGLTEMQISWAYFALHCGLDELRANAEG